MPLITPLSLTKEAFDTDRGLWLATTRQELYPNPHSYAKERKPTTLSIVTTAYRHGPAHQLSWYTFIGQVLGKALYDGILVDVGFASFFLGKVNCERFLTQFDSHLTMRSGLGGIVIWTIFSL